MIEIATIFGSRRMKMCAYLHGTSFETSIPTIGNAGFTLEKIILWSTCRNEGGSDGSGEKPLTDEEKLAVKFLERCLELDPNKRISAEDALEHEFLKEVEYTEDEDDEMHML
jgi:cell division control protein 7